VTSHSLHLLLALLILAMVSCAGPPIAREPDVVDVTLPAPVEQVRTAVIQVLEKGGYEVGQRNDETLTTGYRQEIRGPHDWMLRWRFGTGRSRVDAVVTSTTEQETRLRLHVQYEAKDGLFTQWEDSPTALPQSANNQLRLIKNALRIL
jgi:hypothetical protein